MSAKYISLILLSTFFVSCSSGNISNEVNNPVTQADSIPQKEVWKFEKVVGQTIYFSNAKQFKTNLYDLKYIGQLKTENKAPYLILSGRSCTDCDENISIYIHSPSDGQMKSETEQSRYAYPGKEYDYMDKSLLFESRMFYGDCLKGKGSCVIWVQKQLNEKGVFENNTFILEIFNDNLKETTIKNDALLKDLLNNKCTELSGIEITSEP